MCSAQRIELRQGVFERALVTDTAPTDVPIIFSNEGFYKWVTEHLPQLRGDGVPKRKPLQQFVEILLGDTDADRKRPTSPKVTVPYRFKIATGTLKVRDLCLAHPRSQLRWTRFYRRRHELILYYTSRSAHSLRYPRRIASSVFVRAKGEAEVTPTRLVDRGVELVGEDHQNPWPASFFVYAKPRRMHEFMDSPRFLRLERRYRRLWMLDLADCFGSLYTHSIVWATKGKRLTKDNLGGLLEGTFGGELDKLVQASNWGETNGIPVGSETSRIFAEIILQTIENQAVNRVRAMLGDRQEPFELLRYVDDYFLFANSDETATIVADALTEELKRYNLHFNTQKTCKYGHPFATPRSVAVTAVDEELAWLESRLYRLEPSRPPGSLEPVDSARGDTVGDFLNDTATPGSSLDAEAPAATGGIETEPAGTVGPSQEEGLRPSHDAAGGPSDVAVASVPVSTVLSPPTPGDARPIGGAAAVGNPSPALQSTVVVLKRIVKPWALTAKFIRRIKAICARSEGGYDLIGGFLLGALATRFQRLIRRAQRTGSGVDSSDRYADICTVFLELMFFFFAERPTVAKSLRLADSVLFALTLFRSDASASASRFQIERLVFERCTEFLDIQSERAANPRQGLPAPAPATLNVVLILGQLDREFDADWATAKRWLFGSPRDGVYAAESDYFAIITALHYVRGRISLRGAMIEIEEMVERYFEAIRSEAADRPGDPLKDSQSAHLLLDVLSCPWVSVELRTRLFVQEFGQLARADNHVRETVSGPEAAAAVAWLESHSWFVNWNEFDIRLALRRKRLSNPY